MSEWITFIPTEQDPKKKTRLWHVQIKNSPHHIGFIKWFSAWRKYVFFPSNDTVFEQDCMRDISDFIEDHTRCYKLRTERIQNEEKRAKKKNTSS